MLWFDVEGRTRGLSVCQLGVCLYVFSFSGALFKVLLRGEGKCVNTWYVDNDELSFFFYVYPYFFAGEEPTRCYTRGIIGFGDHTELTL